MHRALLLLLVASSFLLTACNETTSPSKKATQEIRGPKNSLVIPSTTPQVSAGGYFTCALKTGGTVVCWGVTNFGQAAVPTGLTSVAQIDAGNDHTCALKTDGTVICWGLNDDGEATVPGGLASVAQVDVGSNHTCALRTDGTAVCWGASGRGQTTVPSGLVFSQLSANGDYTCALKTDGSVVCWGYNAYGQTNVPSGLASVAQVSAGGHHACALKTDATVVCWGDNSYGQATVPAGLGTVAQVSAGSDFTCALRTDGTVACWGDNTYGEAAVPSGLVSIQQVSAAAYFHACALKTDGTVVCWGDNSRGQSSVPACLNLIVASSCAPVVGPITAPVGPVQVNNSISASANFTEPGALNPHSGAFDWGDGTSSTAIVTDASGAGSANGSHIYSTPGVYTITLTMTDKDGATGQSVFEFVVVFDPAAGFVTGGGWVNSPAGAYAQDVSLTGKATFGFVSRYQKGAAVPTGNTQFQFQAGNLHFSSTRYDWLVIAGPQAKYKGSGTINGAGDFAFLLSAVDGALIGGDGTDKFRIKIWDRTTGGVIYDNQRGATDDAPATTAIAGGEIVIHR